jgi:hypothetical protein
VDGPGVPPIDPDEWTEEQWLAYLEELEAADGDQDDEPVTRVGRLARSTGGQALGSAMMGLAQAMYGVQQAEVVVEAEAPSGPGDDDLQVTLDPDHPTVVVRRRRRPR